MQKITSRRCLHTIRLGIIGSGPAGFYTAQGLLKNPKVHVDFYEKYPVPFGLIRFGVAPDHQSVKNVINSFTKSALSDRVTFYGNIAVGKDIKLKELRDAYHGIVLCYGASEDRKLNIDGEDLENVIAAKDFVGWYNGTPENANLKVDLDTENVAIIGHGNVALDCARILLSPVDEKLKSTDITEHALEHLRRSRVKNVYIIGRRGPLQVSFTIKELREITKLTHVDTILRSKDFQSTNNGFLESLPRPKKRLTEFLLKLAQTDEFHNSYKRCIILFHRSPLQIKGDKKKRADSLILGVNELKEENGQIKAVLTDDREEIRCGLVIRSIGYKAVAIDPTIPMDEKTGVIDSDMGIVRGAGFGLYCSGWAAVGAAGVIAETMNSSFEIASHILADIEKNEDRLVEKPGSSEILGILKKRNIQVVTFSDWQKIDEMEKKLGLERGKIREKFIDPNSMVEIICDKR